MRIFRRKQSTDQLAEAVLDQFHRQEREQLRKRYDWLIGEMELLVAPGRPRVTRAEVRDLIELARLNGVEPMIVNMPEGITPMEVDEIKRRIGAEDEASPTAVRGIIE